MAGRLVHAPVNEMSTPMDGVVFINKYWCVHPEKGLAFWNRSPGDSFDIDRLSPQCNANRHVAEHVVHIHPGHTVQQVAAVYIGNLSRIMK
jgi:hypothetical protein